MADDNKTPVDQLLDLFVYAPLGLALTARDQLPSLVEKGRQQVTQQTTLAKMMGQFAVKEAEKELKRRLDDLSTPPAPPSGKAPVAAEPPAPSQPATKPVAKPAPAKASSTNGKAHAPSSNGSATKPSDDHLAIPGYDTLSASQVVQRLPGLSGDELAAVRAYEEATRGRRTILSKIGQLQAESS